MTLFKKIYYVWWAIAIIISAITILFQPIQLFDYLAKNFDTTKEMKVLKVEFDPSTSRGKGSTIKGKVGNKNVYFSLYDEDLKQLEDYINKLEIPVWEMEEKFDYDNMKNLNLYVPVISFKHSKGVLLVPLNESPENTINSWALSNLYMLLLAFFPLLILSFINKIYQKNKINN